MALIQFSPATANIGFGAIIMTFPAPPTPGNWMVAIISHWSNGVFGTNGWNALYNLDGSAQNGTAVLYKKALAAEPAAQDCCGQGRCYGQMWEVTALTGDVNKDFFLEFGQEDQPMNLSAGKYRASSVQSPIYQKGAITLGFAAAMCGNGGLLPGIQAPDIVGTGVVIDAQVTGANPSTAGGATGFHHIGVNQGDLFQFEYNTTTQQIFGNYGIVQIAQLNTTYGIAFQGVIDVDLHEGLTGYTPLLAGWSFERGAPWPQFSRTLHAAVGGYNDYSNGGQIDVFWDISDTQCGVDKNTWGDQAFGASTGANGPKWNGDVLYPWSVAQKAGVIDVWTGALAMPLRSGGVNFPLYDPLGDGTAITLHSAGAGVTINGYFQSSGWDYIGNRAMISIGDPSGVPNFGLLFSDGFYTGICWHLSTGNVNYMMPDASNYCTYLLNSFPIDFAGSCYFNFAAPPPPITPGGLAYEVKFGVNALDWGDAGVNALLGAANGNASLGTATANPRGTLNFYPNAITLGGVNYARGFILTSSDFTEWWFLNFVPKDAVSILAWGATGGNRSAVMFPNDRIIMANPDLGATDNSIFIGKVNFFTRADKRIFGNLPAIRLYPNMGLGR